MRTIASHSEGKLTRGDEIFFAMRHPKDGLRLQARAMRAPDGDWSC